MTCILLVLLPNKIVTKEWLSTEEFVGTVHGLDDFYPQIYDIKTNLFP